MMSVANDELPTLADVRAARQTLAGIVRRTPILTDHLLDRAVGSTLFVKAEHLQCTAAFKFRGLYNKVHSLTDEERRAGVLTVSSGNAALGAALACWLHGSSCTVVMPARPVPAKLRAVSELGADVVRHGDSASEMFAKANTILSATGKSFVHPYDQPEVIVGHGTMALEILEDVEDFDAIVVPTSGGGMLSGIATVMRAAAPTIDVVGVQPAGADGIRRSLDAGRPVEVEEVQTIADGLTAKGPGSLTFEVIKRYADDVVVVPDEAILEAMALLWRTLRIAVEPAGATALAGVMSDERFRGRRVVVVTSGANVDLSLLQRAVEGADEPHASTTVRNPAGERP